MRIIPLITLIFHTIGLILSIILLFADAPGFIKVQWLLIASALLNAFAIVFMFLRGRE